MQHRQRTVLMIVTVIVAMAMVVTTVIVTAHFMRNDVQKDIAQQPTDSKCHAHFQDRWSTQYAQEWHGDQRGATDHCRCQDPVAPRLKSFARVVFSFCMIVIVVVPMLMLMLMLMPMLMLMLMLLIFSCRSRSG